MASSFPRFDDADVEILLSRKQEDRLLFNSVVLALHSPFFKASLSENWIGAGPTWTSDHQIKWSYQLQFDDAEQELGGAYVKKNPDAFAAVQSPEISTDTAAIVLAQAPWVPIDDQLTSTRTNIIKAHFQYLGLLVHRPLDVHAPGLALAVDQLYEVTRVADVYGSLSMLRIPVEHALHRFESEIVKSCRDQYWILLYIASKVESKWLFREIACRIIGDIDHRVVEAQPLDDRVWLLLERKQKDLRCLMDKIDLKLFMLEPPKRSNMTRMAMNLGTAAFRGLISKHLRSYQYEGPNRGAGTFYRKYRTLQENMTDVPSCRDILEGYADPINMESSDYSDCGRVTRNLLSTASGLIKPLLRDVVAAPVKDFVAVSIKDKKHWPDRGLLCIDIDDDELPWIDG